MCKDQHFYATIACGACDKEIWYFSPPPHVFPELLTYTLHTYIVLLNIFVCVQVHNTMIPFGLTLEPQPEGQHEENNQIEGPKASHNKIYNLI